MFGSGRKAAAQKKAAEEATAKFLAEKFLKEAEEAAAEAEKEVLLALRSAAAAQSAGESAKRAEAHALTAENAAERAISAASVTELAYNKIIAQPETKSPEGDGASGDTVSLDSEQIVKLHALKEPEGRESPPSGETTQPLNPFDEPDAPVRVVLTSVVPHEEPNTEDQIEILQPRESGSDSNPELVQRELEIEKLRQDVTLLKQEEEARRIEQAQEAARAQAEAEAQARAEAEARAHEQARVEQAQAEQARAEQARTEELRKQEEPVAKQSRSGRKPPPPPPKPGGGVTSPPPKPPAELSSTPMTPVSNPMPNLSVLSPVTQPSMEPINEEPTVPAAVSAPPPPPQVKHEEPERVLEPASHAPAPVEEQPTHVPQSTEAFTTPAIVEVENNVHTEPAPFADATPAAVHEPVSAPAEPAATQEAEESQTIGNEHVATSPMTPTTSNGSPSELAEEISAPFNNNNNDHAESNTPAVEETKPAEAEVATTSTTATTDSSNHNEAVPEHKSNPLEGFEVLGVVGKGRFAKVVLARRLSDDAQFAIKIMDKSFLIQQNQVANTMSERRVLEQLRHPFLMKLCFAFESANKLYLGLDFVEGGELFYHGQQQPKRRFAEEAVRLWAAELTLGLGHLHMVKHIVFRDLKPENVLLDLEGHIRLTDFGLAKELGDAGGRTQTFCGAKEYLAPEVIQGVPYGFAVDWWTLGILIYELAVGLPPFFSRNTTEMYAKILHADLRFPPFLSPECVHLVRALLERDPSQRLGSKRDFEELQSHPFFAQGKSGSDLQQYWNDVYNRNTSPIYRPNPNNNSLLQQEAIEDNDATTNDTDRTFAGFDYQP